MLLGFHQQRLEPGGFVAHERGQAIAYAVSGEVRLSFVSKG
jgi:hypothetical protein